MNNLKPLIIKELSHLFNAPTAYIFTAVFLALNNFFYFNSLFLINQASLRQYFTNFPLTLIFFVSLLSMTAFTTEKKSGTLEVLLSLPLAKLTIVLAKFAAILIFFLFVLIFTLPNLAVLMKIGQPDLGPIAGSYLGTLFLVCLYASFGLLISLKAKDQILAFLLSAGGLFVFYLMGEDFILERTPLVLRPIFSFVSPGQHFFNFVKGAIYPRDIIYFLSISIFFIYLSVKNLTFNKK